METLDLLPENDIAEQLGDRALARVVVGVFQHIVDCQFKSFDPFFPVILIGVHLRKTRAHIVNELELLHVLPCLDVAAEDALGGLVVG